jgi:predicted phosphoadenosine phosphosulfate sulfurtransferase
VARVAGINSSALYGNDMGNITGNVRVTKPDGLTWRQFAELLLDTMPPATGEHYRNKLAVFFKYYVDRGVPMDEVPECFPGDTSQKGRPSWRRVCKVLLRNDYWCKGLSFSQTKPGREKAYMDLMRKRREKWGIWA